MKVECPKNCKECPYKTFDSDSSQEFICDLTGRPVYDEDMKGGEKMDKFNLYPVTIVYDRYSGTYSGAKWLAFNMYEEDVGLLDVNGDDLSCSEFWSRYADKYAIGKGSTPDEALANLYSQKKHSV